MRVFVENESEDGVSEKVKSVSSHGLDGPRVIIWS